ncbi:hypothetical protein VTK26DRAFT_9305 [Humicola hyalothermophila]
MGLPLDNWNRLLSFERLDTGLHGLQFGFGVRAMLKKHRRYPQPVLTCYTHALNVGLPEKFSKTCGRTKKSQGGVPVGISLVWVRTVSYKEVDTSSELRTTPAIWVGCLRPEFPRARFPNLFVVACIEMVKVKRTIRIAVREGCCERKGAVFIRQVD